MKPRYKRKFKIRRGGKMNFQIVELVEPKKKYFIRVWHEFRDGELCIFYGEYYLNECPASVTYHSGYKFVGVKQMPVTANQTW